MAQGLQASQLTPVNKTLPVTLLCIQQKTCSQTQIRLPRVQPGIKSVREQELVTKCVSRPIVLPSHIHLFYYNM